MATVKKLNNDDVRAIFEAMHNNHLPPPHLKFQIVPVTAPEKKLSPPSFQFEDGLYVLLRPPEKRKKHEPVEATKCPSNLMKFLMKDSPPPVDWGLSGPQFPRPTAIQQRYCYPKDKTIEYGNKKGGALWTMYDLNGEEDLAYRLLHVYFSEKRAKNKGYKADDSSEVIHSPPDSAKRPTKRRKRANTPPIMHSTPPITPTIYPTSPIPPTNYSNALLPVSPTTHPTTPPSISSIRNILENDPKRNVKFPPLDDPLSVFVTPDINEFGRFHPVLSPNNSPLCPRSIIDHPIKHVDWDSLDLDLEDSSEFDSVDEMVMPPIQEKHQIGGSLFDFGGGSLSDFANNLDQIHDSIKETILVGTEESNQGPFVCLVSEWAQRVSSSPLGNTGITNKPKA